MEAAKDFLRSSEFSRSPAKTVVLEILEARAGNRKLFAACAASAVFHPTGRTNPELPQVSNSRVKRFVGLKILTPIILFVSRMRKLRPMPGAAILRDKLGQLSSRVNSSFEPAAAVGASRWR